MNDTNIGKLSKKSNRKAKKVTDLKTKELNENAMERKCKRIQNKLCQCDFWQQQYFSFISYSFLLSFNPLNPWSDQHLISHYKITPESHIKVMRIKEMIINERSF